MERKFYAGIDIGGTKTALSIYDGSFRAVTERVISTDVKAGCRAMVERIYAEYCAMRKEAGISEEEVLSLGVCSPGPLNLKTGRTGFLPTMKFRDEPLRDYFEEIFSRKIALENDANAAALGEAVFGGGRGCRNAVYITVSTGVGCGVVADGKILDGACFSAGELGHMKVERGGRLCACGGCGCLEAYASGTAIAAIARERTGKAQDAKEVFAAARAGKTPEREIVALAADYLGFAIGAVYQILDPEVVILGGSVTKDWDVLLPYLTEAVMKYCQKIDGRTPVLRRSELNGKQGVLGAAYYAKETDKSRAS